MNLFLRVFLICIVNILSVNMLFSQDSLSLQKITNATLEQYHNSLKAASPIYNGKLYVPFPHRFSNQNHNYFLSRQLSKGAINYNGISYRSVNIAYDIVKDELILLHLDNYSKLVLHPEKVNSFFLLGHTFINIRKDSADLGLPSEGYYDVLHKGKINLLCKRKKVIKEITAADKNEKDIREINRYYLFNGSEYILLTTKKSLLKALNNPNSQQFIKSTNLNFRKNKEDFIINLVKFSDK